MCRFDEPGIEQESSAWTNRTNLRDEIEIQRMTGIILMAAFLAVVASLGGVAFVVTRLLPPEHAIRLKADAFARWIRANPRLFEKRLKQVAFTLLVLFFLAITIIYS